MKKIIRNTLILISSSIFVWILIIALRYVFFGVSFQDIDRVGVALMVMVMVGFLATFPLLWDK